MRVFLWILCMFLMCKLILFIDLFISFYKGLVVWKIDEVI